MGKYGWKIIEIVWHDMKILSNYTKKFEYPPNMFHDVDETQWYGYENQQAIQQAYEYGLMSGHGDGMFSPDGTLTVGEAIKLSAVIHNIYQYHIEFANTAPWYRSYVDYAIENGIIAADTFSDYTRPITRAEMAMLLAHTLPVEVMPALHEKLSLQDVAPEQVYYHEIMQIFHAGIGLGDANRAFHPNNNISRAEAAMLTVRLINPMERRFLFSVDS